MFSGVGGFALGYETAGWRTRAFCENDPEAVRVLRRRWPGVEIVQDAKMSAKIGTIDCITGGIPCQDISLANSGKMTGLDGSKSSAWNFMRDAVERHSPEYVIIENSPVLRGRGLDRVLHEVASLGYDAEWHCIPATAVGAPHSRDRVIVIAYPAGVGDWIPEGQVLSRRHFLKHFLRWPPEPSFRRVDDGVPRQSHRLKQLGNAVVPAIVRGVALAVNEAREWTR